MYNVVFCTVVKDENQYLVEWIEYHLMIGVDFFVVYDNNSSIPVSKTLTDYITLGKVQVILCGINSAPQLKAFNHCLYEMHDVTKWLGFIDVDEFVVLHKHPNLPCLLKDYQDFAGLTINWLVFTASGHWTRPHSSVVKSYFETIPIQHKMNRHVKSIVQPKHVLVIRNPHCASYDPGFYAVNEMRNLVSGPFSIFSNEFVQLNHYYNKSYEEWEQKVAKGRSDTTQIRSAEVFWEMNPGMQSIHANNNLKLTKTTRRNAKNPPFFALKFNLPENFYMQVKVLLNKIITLIRTNKDLVYVNNFTTANPIKSLLLFEANKLIEDDLLHNFAFDEVALMCKKIMTSASNDFTSSEVFKLGWILNYLHNQSYFEVDDEIFTHIENKVNTFVNHSTPQHTVNVKDSFWAGLYYMSNINGHEESNRNKSNLAWQKNEMIKLLITLESEFIAEATNVQSDFLEKLVQNKSVFNSLLPFLYNVNSIQQSTWISDKIESAATIVYDVFKITVDIKLQKRFTNNTINQSIAKARILLLCANSLLYEYVYKAKEENKKRILLMLADVPTANVLFPDSSNARFSHELHELLISTACHIYRKMHSVFGYSWLEEREKEWLQLLLTYCTYKFEPEFGFNDLDINLLLCLLESLDGNQELLWGKISFLH